MLYFFDMQPKIQLAPYLLMALAFIGVAVTSFLSLYAFNNEIPSCAVGGCEKVLTSEYSKFFGVPLAYLGLVYYTYLFGISLLLAIDPDSNGLRFGVLMYANIGLILSILFELLQIFVIGALCLYCAISAALTVAIFAVALWHFRSPRLN